MARIPDGWVFIPQVGEIQKDEYGGLFVTCNVEEKELVMCKNCKYFMDYNNGKGGNCNRHDYDGEYEFYVAVDWFCADGKRREEE